MAVRPNGTTRKEMVLGSETTSLASCDMAYNPYQADSPKSSDHISIPSRAAMAPWLVRNTRCPKRALQFSPWVL